METKANHTDRARIVKNHCSSRNFISLLVALVTALAAPTLATAQDTKESELTPMEESMETMEGAFRNLRRALRSPDLALKEDYLQYVSIMKTEAIKCKDWVPQLIEDLPEAKKGEALKSYLEDMDRFIEIIGTLDVAVQEAKWDEANAAIKKMRKEKSDGHKQYKKEE